MATAAPACRQALRDADALAPQRKRDYDGIMPSAEHHAQNPNSDHEKGNAVDITHDPAHGFDCRVMSRRAMKDKRVQYVIFNREICNVDVSPGVWRPYNGSNPHTGHMHISVKPQYREDTARWACFWEGAASPPPAVAPAGDTPSGASTSETLLTLGALEFARRAGAPASILTYLVGEAHAAGIPPALAIAVAAVESSFNPTARSSAGAVGLMQIMPATAADMLRTGEVLTNPQVSARLGCRLLAGWLRQFGTFKLALLAYNMGPGNLQRRLAARSEPSNGYDTRVFANIRSAAALRPT